MPPLRKFSPESIEASARNPNIIDQNLRKLAETAGFSDIYTQDSSGYFKDIKDYIFFKR